jgi:hypothetical protein
MAGITPIYNIRFPNGLTKTRNLGAELEQLALDLEEALQAAEIPPNPYVGYRDGELVLAPGQSAFNPCTWQALGRVVTFTVAAAKSTVEPGEVIATIPPEFAPDAMRYFGGVYSGQHRAARVHPDGTIRADFGYSSGIAISGTYVAAE